MKNIFVGNLDFGATEDTIRSLFEAYGTVMPEYVAVPAAMLTNTKELKKYLDLSYEYAKTLKPKPSKKKSSA